MQFGVALPAAGARAAAAMGYEFVELRVSELAPEAPDAAWAATTRAIEAAGIPALTYNFFLPPDLRVVGPDRDLGRLANYVLRAAARAASLGGQAFVFGSGGARRVPPGFPVDTALAQFREATTIAAEAAARHDLAIALEPLNHTEANLLHTVADAVEQVRLIDVANVGVVADSYHMAMEAEPFRNLSATDGLLRHVQVCDTGRMPPGSGALDLGGFFIFLNSMGYEGTVAVECAFKDFATEGPAALETVRRTAELRGELTFA